MKTDLKNYQPKGDLIGFPIEVIKWILEQQVAQGNEEDVTVFERYVYSQKANKGFDWFDYVFCDEVISFKKFNFFFERYPKERTTESFGDSTSQDKYLKSVSFDEPKQDWQPKRGKFTELEILEDVKTGFDICSDNSTSCFGYRNLCEKIKALTPIYLTAEQISKGEGVGVEPSLIKFKE